MGRAPCCSKVGLHRGPWTTKEDSLLTNYIKSHGEGHWRSLPKQAGLLRCGKSCRLRWMNYLRPDIKRGNITDQEDDLIIRLHSLLGNRWSLIAGRLPGRTDNEIKNYWNTRLSKKLPVQPTSSSSQPKKITKPKKQCETAASKLTSEVEIEMKLHEVHKPKPVRLGSVRNMSGLVLTSESNNNNNVVESSSFSTGENYMSNNYKEDGSEEGEQEVDDVFLAVAADQKNAAWTDGDIYNGSYGDGVEAYDNIGVWEKLYEEYLQLTNATGCQVEWQSHEESLFI